MPYPMCAHPERESHAGGALQYKSTNQLCFISMDRGFFQPRWAKGIVAGRSVGVSPQKIGSMPSSMPQSLFCGFLCFLTLAPSGFSALFHDGGKFLLAQ